MVACGAVSIHCQAHILIAAKKFTARLSCLHKLQWNQVLWANQLFVFVSQVLAYTGMGFVNDRFFLPGCPPYFFRCVKVCAIRAYDAGAFFAGIKCDVGTRISLDVRATPIEVTFIAGDIQGALNDLHSFAALGAFFEGLVHHRLKLVEMVLTAVTMVFVSRHRFFGPFVRSRSGFVV